MGSRHQLSESELTLLRSQTSWLWLNPQPVHADVEETPRISAENVAQAEAKLTWFAPLLQRLFPELSENRGIIESPLLRVEKLQQALLNDLPDQGRLFIKADHGLPIAGSVKARGGIYEVLVVAERIARGAGLVKAGDDVLVLNSVPVKALFGKHTIAVGSTGNLGLSIGVMAATLGFKAVVHMSADAKAWKRQRLRNRGVTVVEHAGDYARAVAAGREQAAKDSRTHFVDDENSADLFLGYSAAASRLKAQLDEAGVRVDENHPLFVYIPCGVGGAPGGITYGLKRLFGNAVHCFFAEPVASPCMLVQLSAGDTSLSVYDIGLDNKTEADGLAVPAASLLVADIMRPLLAGVFTVADQDLFRWLYLLKQTQSLEIEPSAAAAFAGPGYLLNSDKGREYRSRKQLLASHLASASHILWTTGGAFVPEEEYRAFYEKGKQIANDYRN